MSGLGNGKILKIVINRMLLLSGGDIMKRKIELEQLEDDLKFWKWKILEWDGMNWVVTKQGIKEGFDNAANKAKEEYVLLKLL